MQRPPGPAASLATRPAGLWRPAAHSCSRRRRPPAVRLPPRATAAAGGGGGGDGGIVPSGLSYDPQQWGHHQQQHQQQWPGPRPALAHAAAAQAQWRSASVGASAGGGSRSSLDAADEQSLLWAGYSDLSEQLRSLHLRSEQLTGHVADLQAKLQHQQQQQQHRAPGVELQASIGYLLFFLGFINVAGLLANLHIGLSSGLGLPWAAAKAQAGAAGLKALVGVALPATNAAVVLIFCLQAVKAAWRCLRW